MNSRERRALLALELGIDDLRLERQRRRLSRLDLADRVGVTPSALSTWERGLGLPRDEHLEALRDALAEGVPA